MAYCDGGAWLSGDGWYFFSAVAWQTTAGLWTAADRTAVKGLAPVRANDCIIAILRSEHNRKGVKAKDKKCVVVGSNGELWGLLSGRFTPLLVSLGGARCSWRTVVGHTAPDVRFGAFPAFCKASFWGLCACYRTSMVCAAEI